MYRMALKQLFEDFRSVRLAAKLSETLKPRGIKISKQNVLGWAKGGTPKPIVRDAIVYLYIREKGETNLDELTKNYINKVKKEFTEKK